MQKMARAVLKKTTSLWRLGKMLQSSPETLLKILWNLSVWTMLETLHRPIAWLKILLHRESKQQALDNNTAQTHVLEDVCESVGPDKEEASSVSSGIKQELMDEDSCEAPGQSDRGWGDKAEKETSGPDGEHTGGNTSPVEPENEQGDTDKAADQVSRKEEDVTDSKETIKEEEEADKKDPNLHSEEEPPRHRLRPRKVEREDTEDSQDSRASSVSSKEEKPWEPWKPTASGDKTGWHLICEVVEDWEHLASLLDGGGLRSEKMLLKTISTDFIPEIPSIQEEKEKERRRRKREMAPRRQSARLQYRKIELDEQGRLLREAQEEEERVKAQEEEERKRKLEEERLEEQRRQREERERAREERAKRVLLREERARLIAEGKEIPPELMNGIKNDGQASEEQGLEDEVVAKLQKVLTHCMKHSEAWPFVEPVEEKFAPGYFDIVKVPMNLSEMENKLENNKYTSKEDFIADMDLIVDNCQQYNGEDSDFAMMARNLRNAFHRSFRRMFPVVRVKKEDEDFIINGKDVGVGQKYRVKREASRRASESFPKLLSEEDNEIVTRYNNQLVTYRPIPCHQKRHYTRCVTEESKEESAGSTSRLDDDSFCDFKGYESKLHRITLPDPVKSASPGTMVMDSMIQSRRQVVTSARPSKFQYSPGDQVFDYCRSRKLPTNWKDMPPVLEPEVPIPNEEKPATGTPVPTWSYRRDTLPTVAEDGPPRLRRMVPNPTAGKRPVVSSVQGPPVLEAQSPVVCSSSGGVTQVMSAIHHSGGTVRTTAVSSAPPPLSTGTAAPKPPAAPRVMRISKEDYQRLLAENKIKIVQQAPGGQGQVVKLQAGLQIKAKTVQGITAASATATLTKPVVASSVSAASVTKSTVSPAISMSVQGKQSGEADKSSACTSSSSSVAGAASSSATSVSSSSVRVSSAVPVSCAASPPVPLSTDPPQPLSPSQSPPDAGSNTHTAPSHTTLLSASQVAPAAKKKVIESKDKEGTPNTSEQQFSGYVSGRAQSASSDKKSQQSKHSASDSGLNGTDDHGREGDRTPKSCKRRNTDDDDSDIPLAKVGRSSKTQQDVSETRKTKPKEQPTTAGDDSPKSTMPKINLKGLSSQLASAMAQKRDKPPSKSCPPQSKRKDSKSLRFKGKESAPDQDPSPSLVNQAATSDSPSRESPPSTDPREESDMEMEEVVEPPLLEPVSESESRRGKAGLFESVGGEVSPEGPDRTRSPQLSPSADRVTSAGSKGSAPGSGSGSKSSKSLLKHADSNIFQRMLDFTGSDSPEKSFSEDH
ncbi:uncharacterized protein LOC143286979 isoform X2 [Babylonia areolata]|uniref:uncharacterized protein LOC143286979 isoform X2 n=1 Tax=Babylonia areolata TaxID=304850 RepID=UPI003FD30437